MDKFLKFGVPHKDQSVFEMDGEDINERVFQSGIPELLLQLQTIIRNGATRKFPKEELLLALKLHLKQHSLLPSDNNIEIINNFIKAQCENYCSIHLSGEDERVLWVD